ncbi:MAG: RecX family transcriptional regulator [Methylobacter sp.]|nr:MAG: RecX family transcriptional regulator [Methylobacter sp.]PPD23640.1 MAG: RecX family transcriptional regulator [Methylobacter sp.]PPD37471.1 MAG: RecX family transcriptional regulator [Methylomonas sp.]
MVSEREKKLDQSCLRLLASREHSQKQLLVKLAAKGYETSEVNSVIQNLAAQGWQDDRRYAENYARSRMLKGFGPLRIRYELSRNGVKAFDFETVLNVMECNWMELMEQVYCKKYPQNIRPDRLEQAKRSRFLQQRGFPVDLINAFFDHLNEQPE